MNNYVARIKTSGGIKTIRIQAADLRRARQDALRQGRLVSIRKSYAIDLGAKMSLSDRSIFLERMASMIASRVGVSDALKIIATSYTGTIRAASNEVLHHVENGATLQEALERSSSRYFPESTVAIIRTGSQAGNLAGALREATQFEQELERIKRSSSQGIFSALASFIVAVVALLGSTLYLAPEMLESEFVKASEDSLNIGWVLIMADVMTWIAGFIAILIVIFLLLSGLRPAMPSFIDRVTARIPIYKDLAMAKRSYISLYGLSVLLNAGLRLEEAFRLAYESTGRGELKNDYERGRKAVMTGQSWPVAMHSLHPTDRASLLTAQNREQIARTFKELAHQYKSLYQHRVESVIPMMQLLSALFLSFAGVVMFGVVVLPLLQVTQGIMTKI